jgi:DNA-binding beta-propeller fold protein YncE
MFVGRVEGGEFDEEARELFVTDGYMKGRILVFDMDTMKFKRGWGAYGKPLAEIKFDPNAKYDPKGPPAKDFLGHLTVTVSRDGFVYAADRIADRIQVYTKAGKFVREFTVAPETLDRGSTGGMALSPDQKFIYVSDIMNNVIWIVARADGKTLGHFSFAGHSGGGLHWVHMVATDSKGNVYTGEVDTGKRVQRFLVKN